ncbi:MAG: hypothetical protein IKF36_02205 [Bacilli bacterium]|nr:hypothetical protein [Bacilli bacterium]
MKKVLIYLFAIIGLFTIVGCGSSKSNKTSSNDKKRTYESLLDNFIDGYTKPDIEIVKKIFPPYYMEYAKNSLTQDYLEAGLLDDKEYFGDDFNITYEIEGNEKLSESDLKKMNDDITALFDTKEEASECKKYSGNIIYKGSKTEESVSLSSFLYCKYENDWYIVRH